MKIDFAFKIDSNLKLEFVTFDSNYEFYTQIYYPTHF